MTEVLTINDVSRSTTTVRKEDSDTLFVSGNHFSVTVAMQNATLNIWKFENNWLAHLRLVIYCQITGDILIRFQLEMLVCEALELHAAVPELDFHDERECAA